MAATVGILSKKCSGQFQLCRSVCGVESMKGIYLLIWLLMVVLTSPGFGVEQVDPYKDLWDAHIKGISTIEASFSRKRSDRPGKAAQQQWLRMDTQTGWYRGTVIKTRLGVDGREEVFEDEYAVHDKGTWESTRMEGDRKRFDIYAPGKGMIPRGSQLAELGYSWLKWCYLPFHIELKDVSPEPQIALISQIESKTIDNAEVLTYKTEVNGMNVTIEYEMELTDGVKIHYTEVRTDDQVAYRIRNKDFEKHNGIWIAHESKYQRFTSGQKEPEYESLVRITDVSINKPFTANDFYPDIHAGDRVYDHIKGTDYNHGARIAEGGSEDMDGSNDEDVADSISPDTEVKALERGSDGSTPEAEVRTHRGKSAKYFVLILALIIIAVLAVGIRYLTRTHGGSGSNS